MLRPYKTDIQQAKARCWVEWGEGAAPRSTRVDLQWAIKVL